MVRPEAASMLLGILSLSFFIHNSVLTIMRASAKPRHNQRDLSAAYVLVWICYAGMGVSANLCPPGGSSYALDTTNHIFLEVEQPASLAAWQLLARLAVLIPGHGRVRYWGLDQIYSPQKHRRSVAYRQPAATVPGRLSYAMP